MFGGGATVYQNKAPEHISFNPDYVQNGLDFL